MRNGDDGGTANSPADPAGEEGPHSESAESDPAESGPEAPSEERDDLDRDGGDDERDGHLPAPKQDVGAGSVEAHGAPAEAVIVPVAALAQFMQDAARRSQPRVSRFIARPFELDEQVLDALVSRVEECLDGAAASALHLEAEARYSDLSTEKFSSVDELVSQAAADRDVESLALQWTGVTDDGGFHEVAITFSTELPLERTPYRTPQHETTGISVTVIGSRRGWVRETANSLESLLASTELSVIYRPLMLFRSSLISTIGGWVTGAALFFLTSRLLTDRFINSNRQDRLEEILEPTALSERFERYLEDFYDPDSPFWLALVSFMLPYVMLWVGVLLGARYLPYLVPRSAISLGLGSRRRANYMNAFRIVIFSVITALIVGVGANLIAALIL